MTSYKKLYEKALNELDDRACMQGWSCDKDDCVKCWDDYIRTYLRYSYIRCSFSPSICSLQSGSGHNYCSCTEKCEYQR